MSMKTMELNLLNDNVDFLYATTEVYLNENNATEIVVEIPLSLQDLYYAFLFELPDKTVVVETITSVDNVLYFKLSNTLTSLLGDVTFQIEAKDSENLLYKSKLYTFNVKKSIVSE